MTWDEIMAELRVWNDRSTKEWRDTGIRELRLLPEEFDALKRLCARYDDAVSSVGLMPMSGSIGVDFTSIPIIVETQEERDARLASSRSRDQVYAAHRHERIVSVHNASPMPVHIVLTGGIPVERDPEPIVLTAGGYLELSSKDITTVEAHWAFYTGGDVHVAKVPR